MAGLLDASPYARWNPQTDPFLARHPNNIQRGEAGFAPYANYGKGVLAGLLGFPADVMPVIGGVGKASLSAGGGQASDMPFTSEHLAGLLGADTQSDAFNAGLLGAPDPMDILKAAPKGLLAMTLFHGTPHKFDKFDLGAIGTGEGAQAYGHGLYFAENPGVARSYKSDLSSQLVDIDGTKVDLKQLASESEPKFFALNDVLEKGVDKAERDILDSLPAFDNAISPNDIRTKAMFQERLSEVQALRGKTIAQDMGHLYEVDIPDSVTDKMLDWDAPLREQSWYRPRDEVIAQVKREGREPTLLEKILVSKSPNATGKNIHADLISRFNRENPNASQEMASKYLAEAGIPGIRYLDGQSRPAGLPKKKIVSNFLDELPEDAEFEDISDLIGTGHFSPQQDAVLNALEADDWLGFDHPSQAINAAFGNNLSNWDPSPQLVKAVKGTIEPDATSNIVLFNPDDIQHVKRDGETVMRR